MTPNSPSVKVIPSQPPLFSGLDTIAAHVVIIESFKNRSDTVKSPRIGNGKQSIGEVDGEAMATIVSGELFVVMVVNVLVLVSVDDGGPCSGCPPVSAVVVVAVAEVIIVDPRFVAVSVVTAAFVVVDDKPGLGSPPGPDDDGLVVGALFVGSMGFSLASLLDTVVLFSDVVN